MRICHHAQVRRWRPMQRHPGRPGLHHGRLRQHGERKCRCHRLDWRWGWSIWLGKAHENLVLHIFMHSIHWLIIVCWHPCKTPWLMLLTCGYALPSWKGGVVYRPWTNLEVLCIRQHPCCCKSSASMTLWTPVRSTASVELGGWSQQACLTGVGASTTTTAGADSAAWRRMMVAARPALVALPLGSRSSWSCRSWHGPAPCQGSVSSCWRSLGHCATALMWKRWALIRITIPRQRPMLWGPILSPHQRSIPPWPRNPSLQQSEQHTIAESQQVAVSCNISAACLTEGSGASHAQSAYSAWNRIVRKHYLHLSCGNRKEFEPAAWQFMVLTFFDDLFIVFCHWEASKFCGRVASMRPTLTYSMKNMETSRLFGSKGSIGARPYRTIQHVSHSHSIARKEASDGDASDANGPSLPPAPYFDFFWVGPCPISPISWYILVYLGYVCLDLTLSWAVYLALIFCQLNWPLCNM